jgi:AmmeMemoRadiSam system protein B
VTVTARAPAVAGQFYPADPVALGNLVDALLDAVPATDVLGPAAGYVVPHAGYRYSGATAAHAYADLRRGDPVRRIVLIGPAHFVPVAGCAVSSVAQWHTPLGAVPLDLAGRTALVRAGLAVVDDAAHAPEHSLEVQLPFLQRALDPLPPVLPIVVGPAPPDEVADVIAAAVECAPTGTVVICSTDLSHYLDEDLAQARDARTLTAVLDRRVADIGPGDACGVHALRGLMAWATRTDLTPRLLDRSTSAQAAGDRTRVVGYAALALHRAPT